MSLSVVLPLQVMLITKALVVLPLKRRLGAAGIMFLCVTLPCHEC